MSKFGIEKDVAAYIKKVTRLNYNYFIYFKMRDSTSIVELIRQIKTLSSLSYKLNNLNNLNNLN